MIKQGLKAKMQEMLPSRHRHDAADTEDGQGGR